MKSFHLFTTWCYRNNVHHISHVMAFKTDYSVVNFNVICVLDASFFFIFVGFSLEEKYQNACFYCGILLSWHGYLCGMV